MLPALGWPMPARILDLFTEFRCLTNGLSVPCGNGLLGALAYYGLGGIAAAEKADMRDLAIRGGPFTPAEREALLDYCQTDVDSLGRLLPAMLPDDRSTPRPATGPLHGRRGVDGTHRHADRRRRRWRRYGRTGESSRDV